MNKKLTRTGNSCEIKITIPFYDLDPMHIVWHGNYLKYFDQARSALFDECGVDLYDMFSNSNYVFPVSKTSVKHIASLKHKDEIICKATVIEAKIKIVIDFEIRNAVTGVVCARGRGEQVAVKTPDMELQLRIPENITDALLQ